MLVFSHHGSFLKSGRKNSKFGVKWCVGGLTVDKIFLRSLFCSDIHETGFRLGNDSREK